MKCIKQVFLALLFLALPTILTAQNISGDLTGTLGPGTFTVVGDCQVPAGNSLTIAPGTTLLFIGHFFFNVYGTLTANGTVTDSIKFLREEPLEEYRWGGIRFYSIGSVNSISYTKIDNAKNITTPNYNGGGIYAFGATVNVSHSKITNCQASYGGGVYASESAILNLTDCLFYNNTASNGAGLFLYNYVTSTIRDCMIGKNSSTGT